MPARRHHYIPIFYQKGFSADRLRPMLYVTDLKLRRTFWASPTDIGVTRDFHRVDIPGEEIDIVETAFARLEAELSRALRRIIESRSVADPTDRTQMYILMALMFLKNPRMRELVGESSDSVARRQMFALASEPEAWAARMNSAKQLGVVSEDTDTEAMRKHILADSYRYSLTIPGHLALELGVLNDLANLLNERQWVLLRAPAGSTGFVMSDSPCILTWRGNDRRDAPGFGTRGTVVVFPISTYLAMVGAYEYRNDLRDVLEDTVATANGDIILGCNRQVISRDCAFRYRFKGSKEFRVGTDLLNDLS